MLKISNLTVEVEEKEAVKNFSLEIGPGERHVILGPNGSGKSTLCYALLGHPRYRVTAGEVTFDGQNLLTMTTDQRARSGLFLGFQHPQEIAGMTLGNFLRQAINNHHPEKHLGLAEFYSRAKELLEQVGLTESFVGRGINEGFSGGEKKRAELAQMLALSPRLAILDEIDSGLDVDALRQLAELIEITQRKNGMGILLITHYQKLLHHLKVQQAHVMIDGRIVAEGGPELIRRVEEEGYQPWK
jgi:Fe-S cluster assembly ATP-binding protein